MTRSGIEYDVYIASPLFCEEDNAELDVVEAVLEDVLKLKVFSPRRDSEPSKSFTECETIEEKNAIADEIVRKNFEGIDKSRFVLANIKGTMFNKSICVDLGTSVECGYAIGKDIPIITFNFHNYGLNIMLAQKVVYHCNNLTLKDGKQDVSQLIAIIRSIYGKNQIYGLSTKDLRNIFFDPNNIKDLR